MGAIFTNFAAGTVTDSPLTNAAGTINSANFASLPVVATPDFLEIVLDPAATAGVPEVVKITAHTIGSTTVTVTRGQQTTQGGSAARQHAGGTTWVHALTALDLDSFPYRIVTAKGDMIGGTAAGAVARVPVGFDQSFLRSDSNVTAGFRWGNSGTLPIYSTTAARDAAISTPAIGQGYYLRSNDVNEGVYFNTSAGGTPPGIYRKTWNLPWGYVANCQATTHTGISGAAVQVNGMIVSFTAVANRRYLFQLTAAGTVQGGAAAVAAFRIRDGSNTSLVSWAGGGSASFSFSGALQTIQTPTAGAVSYNVSLETGGTPVDIQPSGTYLVVTDIGPAGAPA